MSKEQPARENYKDSFGKREFLLLDFFSVFLKLYSFFVYFFRSWRKCELLILLRSFFKELPIPVMSLLNKTSQMLKTSRLKRIARKIKVFLTFFASAINLSPVSLFGVFLLVFFPVLDDNFLPSFFNSQLKFLLLPPSKKSHYFYW